MLDIHSKPDASEHNVHGLERASSLAGGAFMISKGLRHGGLAGILQVAVGGLALMRGVKGHCSAKAWLQRHRNELHDLRSDIEGKAADLAALKANADVATRTVTVTGNDSLNSPKL
ncbi:DUF2892 domain-containing protein [Pseudomonas capeferrum]|uniref:YgaP family membrane protein n=1 Tax=Pseudomonas capeferrum TaxID=1495066 RepID=UPI0015E32C7C|nr:DUF2892 domain-containing protein [Pseudomonas capeferrum]MBA1201457.1 DUF2892 domain-containing protein [Pseudomonas capeferrum]